MADFSEQILALVKRRSYQPLKPKALARKLGVSTPSYPEFKRALRTLLRDGRIEIGKNHTVRPAPPHGTVTGIFRRTGTGVGFVRPQPDRRPHWSGSAHRRGRRPRRRHRRRGARPHPPQAQSARPAAPGAGHPRPGASDSPVRRHLLRARRRGPASASTAPSSATASSSAIRGPREPSVGRQGRLRDGALSRRRKSAARASSPRFSGRAASPASIRCRSSAPTTCPTRSPRTPWKRPATPPRLSARTISRAATISPATSSSPSTRSTPATSTTPLV